MKKIGWILCCCCLYTGVFAQGDIRFVRSLSDPAWMNPAYYNLEPVVAASLFYRLQWTKMHEAPQAFRLNLHHLLPGGKWGVGVSGGMEESGYRRNYEVGLVADRGFHLSRNSFLAVGIGLGVNMKRYDWPESVLSAEGFKPEDYNTNRIFAQYGLIWKFRMLTLGAGHTFRMSRGDEGSYSLVNLYGEYEIKTGMNWKIYPRIGYAYHNNWGNNLDIGGFISYRELTEIGLIWRKEGAVGISAEIKILKHLALSYCYDVVTGDKKEVFGASHEVGIKFISNKWCKKK